MNVDLVKSMFQSEDSSRKFSNFCENYKISKTQREVLALVLADPKDTNKGYANTLFVSEKTIKWHLSVIYKLTGIRYYGSRLVNSNKVKSLLLKLYAEYKEVEISEDKIINIRMRESKARELGLL